MFADTGAQIFLITSPFDESVEGMNFKYPHTRIVLNLKKDADKVLEMISEMDVLIENFRPGVLEKLGISHQKVHELNPRVVYVKLTG